ncbi:MAG: cbb3-type cytochrome c oxidase subunit 3 [Candidatus Competibacteraceae bacterium]|nr:cbb3-type cytochrome c oxidase subunit 3 [Candidatus Competibacteraceae bacterium]
MLDWLLWFTHMENSKPLALVLFFGAFCGIVIYVFTGKKRAKRLESYKYIPFDDEPPSDHLRSEQRSHSRKVIDNE